MMADQPVALVTGANGALGRAIVEALLNMDYRVILGCRTQATANELSDALRQQYPSAQLDHAVLDLANLGSVAAGVELLKAREHRLDLLINNAAVLLPSLTRTVDGLESQFGINHLGHFALTVGLKDLLLSTTNSRVITLSSAAHRLGRMNFDDLNAERSFSGMRAYAQSKLANLLFTLSLQRRLGSHGLAQAVHPGYVASRLTRHIPLAALGNRFIAQTPQQAVQHVLMALDANDPGGYFGPRAWFGLRGTTTRLTPAGHALDATSAERLWRQSEALTGLRWPAA